MPKDKNQKSKAAVFEINRNSTLMSIKNRVRTVVIVAMVVDNNFLKIKDKDTEVRWLLGSSPNFAGYKW